MAIVMPSWDHMPVQMRYDVTKACEINLVRMINDAQCRLGGKDDKHQSQLLIAGKVGHFANVLAQDDATKTGIVTILYAYYATEIVFPQQFPPWHLAQFTADSRLRQVGPELRQGRCILSTISIHIFMLCR